MPTLTANTNELADLINYVSSVLGPEEKVDANNPTSYYFDTQEEDLMSQVIVVAPKKYADIARRVAHDLSKQPGVEATFWKTEHYRDNESQVSAKQPVLFLGDEDENEFSTAYCSCISNWQSMAGAHYGYDGARAIAYGDGERYSKEEVASLAEASTSSDAASVATTSVEALSKVYMIAVDPIAGSLLLFVASYLIKRYLSQRRRKQDQTASAAVLFVKEFLDSWLSEATS